MICSQNKHFSFHTTSLLIFWIASHWMHVRLAMQTQMIYISIFFFFVYVRPSYNSYKLHSDVSHVVHRFLCYQFNPFQRFMLAFRADPDIRMRGAKLAGSRATQTNHSGAEGEAYSSRVQGEAPGPKKLEFYVV